MPSTTSGPRPESTSIAIAGSGSESTLVASGEVADPSRTGRLINFPPPVARIADTFGQLLLQRLRQFSDLSRLKIGEVHRGINKPRRDGRELHAGEPSVELRFRSLCLLDIGEAEDPP